MGPRSSTALGTTAAERLAKRLEQDIRRRGLGPGDRYMTAAAAGQLLRVSRAAANRAMAVLAERQLLIRHPSRGSFGGPRLKRPAAVGALTVYILTPGDVPEAFQSIRAHEMISPLRQAMGGITNIQCCFLPDSKELSHVHQVVKSAQDSPGQFGVIAIGCPRQVYQYLIDNAVPSVVLGTPYAGQDDLPSIDRDNMHGGRLLMQYLIRRGHDRIAMLPLIDHRPGDNDFLQGLTDALSEAGRPPNALRVRTIPSDPLAIAAEVERLMAQPDRPTALIVKLEQVGAIAIDVASKMGLAVPGDLEVVFRVRRQQPDQRVEHTHLRYTIDRRQYCEQAAAMLARLWRGVPLEQKHVVIPAELCELESIESHALHQSGASSR